MDSEIIGLLTYFMTGLGLCLFIFLIYLIKKKKRDEKIKKEAVYFSDSEDIKYKRDILEEEKGENGEIIPKKIYEYDLKFHEIGSYFGGNIERLLKLFFKNIESIGSQRSDLINILYLSEAGKLFITTGFTDPKHDSVQFRAGVDLRLGYDENIQQPIQTPKGETGFYYFDYAHDSNIKLSSGIMEEDIKIKLDDLKKTRSKIRQYAIYKRVRAMSSDQRNTMVIFGIGCVGIGFMLNTVISIFM